MQIQFNDLPYETTADNLQLLLQQNNLLEKTGIAVAVNDRVIQRANWEQTHLRERDAVLVITAAAGG